MLFCFIGIRKHNHFMTEILSMVAAAVSEAGHEVDFAFDEFPPLSSDGVYVVIPHEFHGHADPAAFPSRSQCRRTIALCTENPGTPWFETTTHLAPLFGAAMSLNRSSTAELQRRGIRCEQLQLGYSPLWDAWRRDRSVSRPIDVLYLGAVDPRRDRLLAGYGEALWDRHCQLLVPPLDGRGVPGENYVTGADKYRRLRMSRILINLHRENSQALEWVRVLEAICNGCVVLSEPSVDGEPLVAGEHYLAASAESLQLIARRLLDDPGRLEHIALHAYDFIRESLPMDRAADRLVTVAETVLSDARVRASAMPTDALTPLPVQPQPEPPVPPTAEQRALHKHGVVLRALQLQTQGLHRVVAELALHARTGGQAATEVIASSPGYDSAQPRVSVLITVHNYEREVVDALHSVAASRFGDLEVLVVDDASSDHSLAAAVAFLERHPWLPAQVMHNPVNRGLAHSRNILVDHARGEYVFILDADNGIYPSALERLVPALDAAPTATFAYSMVGVYQGGRPCALLNPLPWDPLRLASGNYIDAMALIRRDQLLELGSYTTDPRLTGWEDFHLWCRCAETGRHGILVPQVLAWYRRHGHSMLHAETDISLDIAWSVMRERFPGVFDARAPDLASAPA